MLTDYIRVNKAGIKTMACGGRRRECLRRATAVEHRALETMLQEAGCFASVDGYRHYLHAVAPLYTALETALDAADAARWLPDWPRRRKRDLIRADLREGLAASQPPADAASEWCAGDVFGALYVLEGATLGGAVLARDMRDLGALAPEAACLLDPYGAEQGAMWTVFLKRLEAASLTGEEEAALCPRAVATFALFAAAGESLRETGALR